MADAILADVEASGIYQIRNTKNGKRYIGSAKCFRVRWNAHRALLVKGEHHSPHLQSSWNKHGEDSFAFEVLEVCDVRRLISREQWWLDCKLPEFNVCRHAGSTLGRRHGPKTIEKIRRRAIGRKVPPRSEAYRRKLSLIHSGKPKPEHVMDALQEGRRRRVYTEEQRRQVSESLKRAYSTGLRSRTKSESHKRKIGKHFAKLTDDQVREIRRLRAAGKTCKELALEFDSTPGTVSEICTGKRYRWVE